MLSRLLIILTFYTVHLSAFSQEITAPDTVVAVPPPQMSFLADSLMHLYVVEDTVKYTYDMICEDLDHFLNTYPEMVFEEKVGNSEFGLPLRTVRIGRSEPKANCFFLVGNIHAREDFSSKLVMKFMNVYLLSAKGQSSLYPDAAKYLDSIDIYVMPVANPDGLMIAQEDMARIQDSFALYRDSIKLIESYGVWKANGKGIDLNRTFDDGNFAVKKGQYFQSVPASEGYKGKFPAEPVETQHIQRFIAAKKPLITASFHTKGNILYWADAKTHARFRDIDTKINREVAIAAGFQLAPVSKYASEYGCGLENYVRAKFGLIGTCVELSKGSRYRAQHPDAEFNDLVWLQSWNIPYIYIKNAQKYGKEIRSISEAFLQTQ